MGILYCFTVVHSVDQFVGHRYMTYPGASTIVSGKHVMDVIKRQHTEIVRVCFVNGTGDLAVFNTDRLKTLLSVCLSLAGSERQRYSLGTFAMGRRANRCVNCLNVTAASPKPTS